MRFFLLHWTCLGWPRMPHYILLLTTLRQNKYSKKRRCLNDLISYACKNNLHKFNLQNNNSNNCWIHHCHAICTDIFMAQTVIEDWGRETARNCTYKRRLYIPPSRQPLPRRNRMCMEHELKWYLPNIQRACSMLFLKAKWYGGAFMVRCWWAVLTESQTSTLPACLTIS